LRTLLVQGVRVRPDKEGFASIRLRSPAQRCERFREDGIGIAPIALAKARLNVEPRGRYDFIYGQRRPVPVSMALAYRRRFAFSERT